MDDDLVLPPIPLATGRVFRDHTGNVEQVTAVRLVVRTAEGGEIPIDLEYRHGGWWAPAG